MFGFIKPDFGGETQIQNCKVWVRTENTNQESRRRKRAILHLFAFIYFHQKLFANYRLLTYSVSENGNIKAGIHPQAFHSLVGPQDSGAYIEQKVSNYML